jgi:CBS domain-containing protein
MVPPAGTERMKPVSELLKRHDGTLWHVTPDMTVYAAVETLARLDAGALLVMEGDRLAGVFSERDYTRKITLAGRNSKETFVSEIMTANVITVNATTRTRECMSLMSARRIRHLPVVEGERVLGMISIRDIMDDIIADHEHTIASLESYIQS